MPTVYVETYGCQMNVADTDLVLGLLERAGYARTTDPACADVILINKGELDKRMETAAHGIPAFKMKYRPSHLYNVKRDLIGHYNFLKGKTFDSM